MPIEIRPPRPPNPDSLTAQFEVSGEEIALLGEIDDWCAEHVGMSGRDWSRDPFSSFAVCQRGVYTLMSANRDAVFAFRLRWCR